MKRFTERDAAGDAWVKLEDGANIEEQLRAARAAIERLAYYEDLEEQGMLKVFPCKVGETVYTVTRATITQSKKMGAPVNRRGKVHYSDRPIVVKEKKCTKSDMDKFGKTVFANFAAAQVALAKAQAGKIKV